jgi:hypothetical protein
MNTQLEKDQQVKFSVKNILNRITPSACSLAILTQLPSVQATCYTACEKSCNFECDTLFDNVLTFSLVSSGIFVVSTAVGYCLYKKECLKKNKDIASDLTPA